MYVEMFRRVLSRPVPMDEVGKACAPIQPCDEMFIHADHMCDSMEFQKCFSDLSGVTSEVGHDMSLSCAMCTCDPIPMSWLWHVPP